MDYKNKAIKIYDEEDNLYITIFCVPARCKHHYESCRACIEVAMLKEELRRADEA